MENLILDNPSMYSSSNFIILSDENLKSVTKRMGGDVDLLISLLSLLTFQTQIWVDECDRLLKNNDCSGVCRWLHTLKGTMGSLGFEVLYSNLDYLERCGNRKEELILDEWWNSVSLIRHCLCELPSAIPGLIGRLQSPEFSNQCQ